MEEFILCAAIWIDDGGKDYVHQPKNIEQGFIVAGRRHHNCFTTLAMLQGLKKERSNKNEVQGFITSLDRFVDRQEGAAIAFDAGQINENKQTLYSEDLY